MIAKVSVGGETGKWSQMHFMPCFFSNYVIPLISTVDDFTVSQLVQFCSVLLFSLNLDVIFQTYHVSPELSLRSFFNLYFIKHDEK